jgi:hypothetical protein
MLIKLNVCFCCNSSYMLTVQIIIATFILYICYEEEVGGVMRTDSLSVNSPPLANSMPASTSPA